MITKLIAALNTVNCAVGKNITYNSPIADVAHLILFGNFRNGLLWLKD